jgi:hypothetical protein
VTWINTLADLVVSLRWRKPIRLNVPIWQASSSEKSTGQFRQDGVTRAKTSGANGRPRRVLIRVIHMIRSSSLSVLSKYHVCQEQPLRTTNFFILQFSIHQPLLVKSARNHRNLLPKYKMDSTHRNPNAVIETTEKQLESVMPGSERREAAGQCLESEDETRKHRLYRLAIRVQRDPLLFTIA